MKIGIITYHAAHNFGSMLQAYALKTYLTNEGYEVEILNFRSSKQKAMYAHPLSLKGMTKRKLFYSIIHPYLLFQNIYKWKLFEVFLNNYLSSSEELNDWNEVYKYIQTQKIDVVITGSDQIWNQTCVDYDNTYMLPSTLKCVRKISYAASLGGKIERINTLDYNRTFAKYLRDFQRISVREKAACDYLSKLLHRNIEFVPDPTLLLDANCYESLIDEKPIVKENYLFYYSPFPNYEDFEIAKALSKKLDLPLVVPNKTDFMDNSVIAVNRSGPTEFLNLIKYSTVVCGKSFHVLVFAIIFKKNFYAIDGFSEHRKRDLLTAIGLQNRNISKIEEVYSLKDSSICYEKIAPNIECLKKIGIIYLRDALKN